MDYVINKTFNNGEYIKNEVRGVGRTMFSMNVGVGYSQKQKFEAIDTINTFIRNGKKKDVLEVLETAKSVKHLLGLIESVFMSKHIKVRKPKQRKIKIKINKKVTDIALDKFYIIY